MSGTISAMVLRDRDADANAGNGLEERLYVLQDVNFNVTAVISTTPSIGEAVERYLYDPYGSVTVLDGDWGTDTDGLSDVAWTYLHQGGQFDAVTGLYHFRHRDYDPNLGRWLQQDPNPAGVYADGMDLYQYLGSSPVTLRDPQGLQTTVGGVAGGGGATTRPATPGEVLVPMGGAPAKAADFLIKCEETVVIGIGNAGGQIGATVAEGATFIFHDLWFGRKGRPNAWKEVQKGCNEVYRQVWSSTQPTK